MLDAYENNLQFAVSAYLDDGFQKNDSGKALVTIIFIKCER